MRAADHVKVRDDAPLLVPDEARARALRHTHDVGAEEVAHVLRGRDVDDGRAHALEHRHRVALVGRQGPARHDGARLHGRGTAGDRALLRARDSGAANSDQQSYLSEARHGKKGIA